MKYAKISAIICASLVLAGCFFIDSDESSAASNHTINVGSYFEELYTLDEGDWICLSWDIVSGQLPPGLYAVYDENANKYGIRGTPTTPGHYEVTFEYDVDSMWDASGGQRTYIFDIVPSTVVVSFNSNGGSAVASQSISKGGYASQPAAPSNGVKLFGGWYSDSGLTQLYDFNTPVTSNITLYAKWIDPTVQITSGHSNSEMTVGALFDYNVTTNPSGATVSVAGANWISVSGHRVYGTPTTAGTYNVTIYADADGYNGAVQSFSIIVKSILAPSNSPSNGAIAYLV